MVGRRHHLVRNEQGTTLRQDNHNRLDPKVADQFYLDLIVTFAPRGDFRSPFQGRRVGWWVPNTGEDAEHKCEFTRSRGCNYLDVVREGRREAGRQGAKKRELGGWEREFRRNSSFDWLGGWSSRPSLGDALLPGRSKTVENLDPPMHANAATNMSPCLRKRKRKRKRPIKRKRKHKRPITDACV